MDAKADRARKGTLCINMYMRSVRVGGHRGEGCRVRICVSNRPNERARRTSRVAASRIRDEGLQKGPLNRRSLPLHRILISAASRSSVRLSMNKKMHRTRHTTPH